MRIAAETGLPAEQRSALFYALLLKDAGCSSSSARMAMLFGTDDIELKRLGKVVDWQRPSEALRFTAANVARGEPRLVRAAVLAGGTATQERGRRDRERPLRPRCPDRASARLSPRGGLGGALTR